MKQISTTDQYIIDREEFINDPLSQPHINYLKAKYDNASESDKLKMLGFKSAKKHQVLTEAEDKAKRESRFAEDNIVNAWAKWFKKEYIGIPFMIDKIAQKRNRFSAAVLSSANYMKGNPDINIQASRGVFKGCYIEQKKDDDIFYTGTRILKPGADNRHIWQSLYHADLREQGYWVMFSISLESSKKISTRYMAGNPYEMQVFPYYCKPEDYAMFEFHKHFKPVKDRP